MKAAVNKDTCIGCGNCAFLCPAIFKLDEDRKSTVIIEETPAKYEPCVQEARAQCPVTAITVE